MEYITRPPGLHGQKFTSVAAALKESISRQLAELPLTSRRKGGIYGRKSGGGTVPWHLNIVSPQLCDDVLNLIGPSLEPYKGCDIIDIHPGPCVWSEKLHDFLKPRRHLLLEPEEAYVQPFIKPLLDRPNSAYVHSTLSGANPRSYWATYDKIFDGKLLPEREPLKENDPRLRETDYSLLVTGGLHRYNKDGAQIKNHVNYANMITSQMALASQTNTMFHKSGLVRMLFWLPHDVQTFICPRTLTQKSALSMPIEVATKLDVIVSPDAEPDAPVDDLRGEARLRAPRHERVMADRVLARMDGANISLPEHRRNPQHQAAIDRKNKTKKPEPRAHGWHPDVEMSLTPEQLRDEVKSLTKDVNDFVSIAVYRFRRWVTKPDNGAAELAAIKYNWADSILGDKSPGETIRSGFYMDLYGRQLRVEREFAIHASEFPTAEQESLKKDILASSETLRETWKTINLHLRMRLRMFADEDRGVLCDPPISQYDRRQFEPLMCNKDEFWPNYPMCLLDMTPRKENLASDITSAHEATHAMRDVAQALFTRARHPIPYSLERMAPMAGHDLIRDTPIMTDPLRGGRMNANDMTNRTLTSDMFRQLVVSYLEWPFRPTTAELAASASLGDVAEGRTGLDEIDRID